MNDRNGPVEWNYAKLKGAEEDAWDRQFEKDVLAGKLDFLKAEVEQAKHEGTLGILQ